ncbi:hypothetical protein A2627_03670 [Candidatus Woesebacteria bacterium RIFCSPHIGHO2_01_FULL_39_28]|uniref:Glycosyl hydrolases family 39 N-terminal catalytic domain-containing protein n=1 Tax=Candidatus Woesebacteria bacterium RIFCSPHIGHO2_01_FULL_39_28 TaxID=1802496 RepID=A0A1F7YFL5_9BACT|nr:MAG: hypothetical protein A2627_03670 [Candidatus Woesebacteria bacterium RIFCSPHIGHO2_01_FULL_39_28]OGM58521.1 MAG: hypothetical protein A3A50_00680 [Candidatus Woesebacteria bacterium RIFCSPLOWO2_01_FULL_38_20]
MSNLPGSKRGLIFLFLLLLSIPFEVYLVKKAVYFFGKASGIPANLVIDTSVTYEGKSGVWENFAQGGEEKDRMFQTVINKIKPLSPEYIRIDHIFDYYDLVERDRTGNIIFNWSKLDLTIKDIVATNAKPFFALSYMPVSLTGGSVTDLPLNWNEWELLVQKTVEHYSGKGGLGISNIYYEVWNEPDLFGNFKTSGEKSYFDLYSHSVAGASKAVNVLPFKIGGPATTALYKNWFTDFLRFVQDRSLRLDFYSWHLYTRNLDDYERDVSNIQGWITAFPNYKNLELIISETGLNSENNPGYDNNFGAIHVIASAAVLEGIIDREFIFEVKDGPGPDKFWGRWGILTNDKFGEPTIKPRYKAIEFLNKMSGKRLNIAGVGSWVKAFAKKDNNNIKVLVVNYDSSGKHSEAVPITFANLSSQNFLYKRTDFLGGQSRLEVATTSATWSKLEYFPPNSAAIFEITPK